MISLLKLVRLYKARAHRYPLGTERVHGGVLKVKTVRGWVPVEREKRMKGIEKGRSFPIGTRRMHGGVLKQKTQEGWTPVKSDKSRRPDTASPKSRVEGLATITEYGNFFETGRAVTFNFVRNLDPAPKLQKWQEDRFQQRVEPAGRYMTISSGNRKPSSGNFATGEITFKKPLVLKINTNPDKIYDENSWKMRLSRAYGGKTGKALSRAVAKDGYDGIVTVMESKHGKHTSETVDLRFLHSGKIEKADSYEVPQGVQSAARRGLELRRRQPKSKKAGLTAKEASKQGIGSGVQRASNLMSGRVSKETIKRIHRYFSRHASNYKLDPGKKPEEDGGYVAGLLWGGEAGKRWAGKMVERFKREEEVKKARKVPKKYLSGLSESKKKERKAEIRRRAKTGEKNYKPLPGDKNAKTKPSKYTRSSLAKRVREETKGNSDDEFLRVVGRLTGISTRILRQVHKRGAAAWSSGHRPGATQVAWARARVYSFATGGKTRSTADKDLWSKHLKMKKGGPFSAIVAKATPPTNKPPENGGVNPDTGTVDKPPAGYTGFGSKRGGFRKPKAGGGYDYWYPGTGHSKEHHPKDSKQVEKLRRAEAFFEKVKQKVENGEYEGEQLERAKEIMAEYERKIRRRKIQDPNPTKESESEVVDENADRIQLPKTASNTHIILSSMGLTLDTPGIVTDRGLLVMAVSSMGTLVFGRTKWMRDGDKWYPKNNKYLKFSNAELVEHLMKTMSPKEIAESIRDRGKRKEERRKRRQEEAGAPVQEEISRDTQLGQMGI